MYCEFVVLLSTFHKHFRDETFRTKFYCNECSIPMLAGEFSSQPNSPKKIAIESNLCVGISFSLLPIKFAVVFSSVHILSRKAMKNFAQIYIHIFSASDAMALCTNQ